MKVYQINGVCGHGSTGVIAADILALLKAGGDAGRIAFGIGEAKRVAPADTFKMNTKWGYLRHNALSRFTDHAGFYSAAQTRRLIADIDAFAPDVIHLHNLHGYYIDVEVLFAYLARAAKPVVWTLHDCWAMTGHCTHFASVGCTQWQTGCRSCALLRSYPKCLLGGDVARNYARKKAAFTAVSDMTIVSPSKWLAELAARSYLGKYPVAVIPNGVDTTVFRPRESTFRKQWGLENKKIVLGVANVWNAKKGLSDFIELSKRLDASHQIVLVGLTERQQAALPDGILGIPRTQNAVQLAEIYSAADVFVNPTYEDTFPTVNMEALSCATPIVVYETGGCPETVTPENGAVVPVGDTDGLCREIRRFCAQTTVVETHGRFDQKQAYQQYLALYKTRI